MTEKNATNKASNTQPAEKPTKVEPPILTKIQNELKVPKGQYNSFGKFHYRSTEDIEQALKPLLAKYGVSLHVDNSVTAVGDRIYQVAIIHYSDSEQDLKVQAMAREPQTKKGMDDSQISGTANSYATKRAFQSLFLLDDEKDADSYDNRGYNNFNPNQGRSYSNSRNYQQNQNYGGYNRKQQTPKYLGSYAVDYKGQSVTFSTLMKHFKEGNETVKQFVNTLSGQAGKNWIEYCKQVG